MARILIPTPLRQFADKQDTVDLPGATVGEVLTALTARFPDLKKQLYNDEGKLRSFVNVYLNDEDIRYLNKDATPVKEPIRFRSSRASQAARVDSVRLTPTSTTFERRNSPLQPAPDHARSGHGRPVEAEEASVLLVGTGGLGAPLGLYLAAAGIGRIGLVDFDVVDFTNLQRQVIHGTKDVGKKKLDSAIETMRDINPFVKLDRHEIALTSENALRDPQGLRHHRRRHR